MFAQKDFEKGAIIQARQMAKSFNSQDYKKYVDYLVPLNYGNNPDFKEKFAEMLKRGRNGDTATIKIVKCVKSVIYNNQNQVLILNRYRNSDNYIFGISNDKGKNWLFTQSMPTKMNFDGILTTVPTLDTSFSTFVDSKYGKRINYETGKKVVSFKYTDIQGKILSSDSLKGKVIVMNFWSISCGPCIKEMPELNELVTRMKGKNVVFMAPAFYSPKEVLITNFLPAHPFNYQIVSIENDDDYNVNSFPTHIIIDKNSKIIDKFDGYSPDNLKRLEQTIEKLLKD